MTEPVYSKSKTAELLAAYEKAKTRLEESSNAIQCAEERLSFAQNEHEAAHKKFIEADQALQAHLDTERARLDRG